MTSRARQATGSASATLTVSNGVEASSERSLPFSWDEWFRHASPQQRAAALGLAQQQGLLYPHQLPALTNGVKPAAPPAKETAVSTLLSRLLAGKPEILPTLKLEPITFFDADLDALQQQAVLCALGTPDVFLLQGLPGAGKSRVLAEIILQAAARGRRVLLLAAQSASVDVILERLVGRSVVFALRFLDTHEKLETLPAWLRGFTLEEQKQAFLERTLTGARGNRDEVEATCRARRDEEPLWTELPSCLERCRAVADRLRKLDDQIPRLAQIVERDAETPFGARLAELRRAWDESVQEMDARLQTHKDALAQCEKEAAELAARIAEREPGYRAKKHTRFWTLAFWLNLFSGQIIQETETLLEEQAKVQSRLLTLAQEIDQVEAQRKERLDRFGAERAAIIGSEIETRRHALLRARQTLEDEARRLDDEWNARCRRLNVGAIEKTSAAVAAAQQAWLHKKQLDEEQCQFAHQWSKFVEETGPQLAARLPSFANLLAGTIQRWNADAKFQTAVADSVDFLIIEDADTLTDVDLLKLSRQAQRCILSAQALAEAAPAPVAVEKTPRAPLASAASWNRLWQTLGGDEGVWPCTWHREQGRLVCQLLPLSAEDRQHLECEGLADTPDIDLGILHRPRSRPCLAQVVFSAQSTFADAFTFMVREVQEFPLQPLGRTGWWSEDEQRVHRHLGPNAGRIVDWLPIEPGVRLGAVAGAHGDAMRIAHVEFDKSAGWDRVKADAWLYRHRLVQDHERTAFLQTPYRFQRSLGNLVQAVVRAGEWLPTGLSENDGRAFEFVAVPALQKHAWPREGAGLELDLSASRHVDRLPVGLRQGLPPRGFVNYLEAQALIRRLEMFVQKDVNGQPCRVAVLALYEGQVELLRRLVAQSEILRGRSFPLEVALPSRLCQRECDVVFLSLTRSHGHRAVAFGDDVRELPLALTRARARLFVFGDPGSLCKRLSWHGPLDNLDAHAAHQELVRLSRLVPFLQSQSAASNGQH